VQKEKLKNPVIDYRPKAEREKVEELPLKTCLICQKKTQGYGVWVTGVTCSKTCEAVKEAQPRDFGENHATHHHAGTRSLRDHDGSEESEGT